MHELETYKYLVKHRKASPLAPLLKEYHFNTVFHRDIPQIERSTKIISIK